MRISHFTLVLAAALLTQPVFLDKDMNSDSKPCCCYRSGM